MELIDALKLIDPAVEDNWTATGDVRLDVVSEKFGSKVTRDEIKAVAPNFNRDNTTIEIEEGETSQPWANAGETQAQPEPVAAVETPAPANGEMIMAPSEPVKPVVQERDAEIVEKELVAAQALIDKYAEEYNTALNKLNDARKEADVLITELASHSSRKVGQMTAIQAFQRNEAKKRAAALGQRK